MNDTLRVGASEPGHHLVENPERLTEWKAPATFEFVPEGGSLHELHGQKGNALLEAPVVDRDDVRVLKPARRSHLALKPAPDALVLSDVLPIGLDRDRPAEERVARLVDDAHGAATELGNQLVTAELFGMFGRRHVRSIEETKGRSGVEPGGSGRRNQSGQRSYTDGDRSGNCL